MNTKSPSVCAIAQTVTGSDFNWSYFYLAIYGQINAMHMQETIYVYSTFASDAFKQYSNACVIKYNTQWDEGAVNTENYLKDRRNLSRYSAFHVFFFI